MTNETKAVGEYGERIAERHLCDEGLILLERNWRCADGEVDLILRDGDDLVFCEVKTRRGTMFGLAVEAINPAKIRRLRRLAAIWLSQNSVRPREVRFDVVSVLPQPKGPAHIDHLRAAF
ncbi:YraN family protein [Actinoplanes sp. TFC3]|uniref:YraN family protein n=1 Tax=Actinoplanes sp. TFC3 TaxID=1710355 RepID=UPI000833E8DA|nr:YraN family protein [Actinoplanes sp. TFC3]